MSSETGKVKFFNEEKRFGFITLNGSEKDVFVHKSGTLGPIQEGDNVEFDVESVDKGQYATNVRVV